MTTVFAGGLPPEVGGWLERRRRLGLDARDEVWEGVLHVAPYAAEGHGELEDVLAALLRPRALRAGLVPGGRFNLGVAEDYRVPDLGYKWASGRGTYVATAAVVVEVLSPGDETLAKLPFYSARGVREVLVVDPGARAVRCWELVAGAYEEAVRSRLLGVSAGELAAELGWG